jgi:hypothetical protein
MGIDEFGKLGGIDKGVYIRHNPWHRGSDDQNKIYLQDDIPLDAAFDFAFPFEVVAKDVYVNIGDDGMPVMTKDETRIATVRSDNGYIMGVHSSGYGIVQPTVLKDLLETVQMVAPEFNKKLNIFSLFGGRVNVVYVERETSTVFGGGDVIVQRGLALITSHDGSYVLGAIPTNTVAECMNTVPPKSAHGIYKLRHTKNVEDYIPAMRAAVGMAYANFDDFDREVDRLLAESYTRAEFTNQLLPAVIGQRPEDEGRARTLYDNKFDQLAAQWGAFGQRQAGGTKWGALMSVNSWELWEQSVRGRSRAEAQLTKFMNNNFPMTSKAQKVLVSA